VATNLGSKVKGRGRRAIKRVRMSVLHVPCEHVFSSLSRDDGAD